MIMTIKAAFILLWGILFLILGIMIRKTHRLTLIHSAWYGGVKPADIRAYTSLVGFGVTLIGIGICLTGLLAFAAKSGFIRIPALAGLVAGCIFINRAQNEYNGK
jgi:hypothetical protein